MVHSFPTRRSSDLHEARCTRVRPIALWFGESRRVVIGRPDDGHEVIAVMDNLNDFARRDGFANWQDFAGFFKEHYGVSIKRLGGWRGLLIEWEPLS